MIFPDKNLQPMFEQIYREVCIELVPVPHYDGNPELISCENRNKALATTVERYSQWLVNEQNISNNHPWLVAENTGPQGLL